MLTIETEYASVIECVSTLELSFQTFGNFRPWMRKNTFCIEYHCELEEKLRVN